MSLEPFGSSERNWTDGEKEHVRNLIQIWFDLNLLTG